MDKQPITEEMNLEKEWFEEAESVKSIEELSKFVNKMLNSYEHDYGTAVHAIAACSVACSWLGAHVEGITHFQASLVMWDYIRNWTKTNNKCGLRLVDYDDFLYPQYAYKYDKVISERTWASIQEEARKLLDKDNGSACFAVRRHWESIINGVVPFGYEVEGLDLKGGSRLMSILNMTKKDFDAVPRLDTYTDWEKLAPNGHLEFRSFVIIPVYNEYGAIDIHDSGWGCMEFCLIDQNNEPIGKVGGGSDVVNLDGIGGYGGNWLTFTDIHHAIPVHGWFIDLLPCGYLNVWTKRTLYLKDGIICSNFEVFSEDK